MLRDKDRLNAASGLYDSVKSNLSHTVKSEGGIRDQDHSGVQNNTNFNN